MNRDYSDVKVGILQVHTNHLLMWLHVCYYRLKGLHLEQGLANNEDEELQVQDGPVASVFLGYYEVGAVKPAPLPV